MGKEERKNLPRHNPVSPSDPVLQHEMRSWRRCDWHRRRCQARWHLCAPPSAALVTPASARCCFCGVSWERVALALTTLPPSALPPTEVPEHAPSSRAELSVQEQVRGLAASDFTFCLKAPRILLKITLLFFLRDS